MIDPPKILQSEPIQVARLHLTIPKADIQKVMGPALQEVYAALSAQRIKSAGAWFSHHLRTDPKVWDYEICVPTTTPIQPSGRVTPGQLPPIKVARTVYRGGYEGLGGGWSEFMQWIERAGHKTRSDFWEVYLVGPEAGGDTSQWQTQLNRPLAD